MARAFVREGMDVKLRRCREKPQRTTEHEQERVNLCNKMRRWPLKRFLEDIDLIIDDKRFEVPTTPAARVHLKKPKMVAQLRTPAEGLPPNFTKPKAKAHRRNLGCSVTLCAGISKCRSVLWEYLRAWSGQVAADMYKGAIRKAVAKRMGREAVLLDRRGQRPGWLQKWKSPDREAPLGPPDDSLASLLA